MIHMPCLIIWIISPLNIILLCEASMDLIRVCRAFLGILAKTPMLPEVRMATVRLRMGRVRWCHDPWIWLSHGKYHQLRKHCPGLTTKQSEQCLQSAEEISTMLSLDSLTLTSTALYKKTAPRRPFIRRHLPHRPQQTASHETRLQLQSFDHPQECSWVPLRDRLRDTAQPANDPRIKVTMKKVLLAWQANDGAAGTASVVSYKT